MNTEKALADLAAALPAPGEPLRVLAALVTIGCALADDRELPKAVREWMARLEKPELEAAIALARPAGTGAPEQRDQAEAASRAALRVWMARGWPLPQDSALATVRASLKASPAVAQDSPAARVPVWFKAGALALAATLLFGVGLYALRARTERQLAIETDRSREQAERLRELERLVAELKAQEEASEAAKAAMAQARSEADRAAARARLAAVEEQQRRLQANISSAAGAGAKTPRAACTCAAGDPLCSCL